MCLKEYIIIADKKQLKLDSEITETRKYLNEVSKAAKTKQK